jgi:CHAT domain-containing protein
LLSKTAYLITATDRIIGVSYPIKVVQLRRKEARFFRQLSEVDVQNNSPKATVGAVQKTGKELYQILFAPLSGKLREFNIKPDVLMWSLDGALRYLPVAALFDGRQYMGERYRNVVFTRANSERMLAPVSPTWTGSGFYNSREYSLPVRSADDGKMKMAGFNGLKNAKAELETIFGVSPKRGIIGGDLLPNEQFTKVSLFKALKLNRPLVHIASHFQFEAGDASSSFLLLGDGSKLTLEDIKNAPDDLFNGVELLTLSACETGVQKERESDGREIDSFAELAQRKGAKAVLASLWKVDDASTSQLMTQFYGIRESKKLTKVEALQKAQLTLLNSKDFSHPYYWAPFILIGNWR